MNRQRQLGWVGCLAIAGMLALVPPTLAQSRIEADETLGRERSVVNPNFNGTPNEVITGGARRGRNLFHSFREFNISAGRGAYFLSPDLNIRNILARVTGATRSEILGQLGALQLNGNGAIVPASANLFLINPNGIFFGPNSSLYVGGSFVATTANAIQFGEQGFFSATNPEFPNSRLTVNPSALLLNQITAAAGILNQSTAGLSVPSGQSLLLVGGNITLDGGRLFAPGGRIELAGLADAGAISLSSGDTLQLNLPTGVARSNMTITNGAGITTAAGGGGDIAITGNEVMVANRSSILTGIGQGLGTPGGQAGDLTVNATGTVTVADGSFVASAQGGGFGSIGNVTITGQNIRILGASSIASASIGQGNAGDVSITAIDTITLSGRSRTDTPSGIFSSVANLPTFPGVGIGSGGDIQLRARAITLADGALISTTNLSDQGGPGNIRIQADVIRLADGSKIATDTGGAARAGDLTIATRQLLLNTGGQLTTSTAGAGRGGTLTITADVIEAIGQSRDQRPSGIGSEALAEATDRAGNVIVSARQLRLQDGAFLTTSTFGRGAGGNLTVQVRDRVEMSGFRTLSTGLVLSSGLFTTTQGAGNAGTLSLTTGRLTIRNGGQIQTSALSGAGRGGNMTVKAETIDLIGSGADGLLPSALTSESNSGSTGNAGNIRVTTNRLRVLEGADISTSTYGSAAGGNLQVTVEGATVLDGIRTSTIGATSGSGLFTTAQGTGRAGTLRLTTDRLTIRNGAGINISTYGSGRGGDLTVDVRGSVDLEGTITVAGKRVFASGLFSTTEGSGAAGTIRLRADRLTIDNGAAISAATYARGTAGDISIVADVVQLTGRSPNGRYASGLSSESAAIRGGRAGNIVVHADRLHLQEGATISTSTYGSGRGGNLQVRAQESIIVEGSGITQRRRTVGSSLSTTTQGSGDAGKVELNTPTLLVRDRGDISATTSGSGDAGDIYIEQPQLLSLENRAAITASTSGQGSAGSITVRDAGTIALTGGSTIDTTVSPNAGSSNISSPNARRSARNRSGSIMLSAAHLNLSDRSSISARSQARRSAGTITLDVSEQLNAVESQIETDAPQSAGGDISINAATATGVVILRDSDIITNSQNDGGDITLNAGGGTIAFGSSNILTASDDQTGGDITLGAFFSQTLPPDSEPAILRNGRVNVNANGRAAAGQITTVDTSFIQNSLAELPQTALDASTLLINSCVVRDRTQRNRFTVTGAGGFPVRPGQAQSTFPTGTVQTLPTDPSEGYPAWQMGDAIVEPQGVYQLPDGRLVMSRDCPTMAPQDNNT